MSKKLFMLLALIVLIATFVIPALAQSDAGFLESNPPQGSDPFAIYSGPGWYCISHGLGDPPAGTIVAGVFSERPDCSQY